MTTVNIGAEVGESLIVRAEGELRRGERIQACETAWGATDRAVKSVADAYGWPHAAHADLFSAIDCIVRLTGDMEIYSLFVHANALRQNIYEGWLSEEHIAQDIENVKRLLIKLCAFMDAGNNGAGG